jgi:hypothetical protein
MIEVEVRGMLTTNLVGIESNLLFGLYNCLEIVDIRIDFVKKLLHCLKFEAELLLKFKLLKNLQLIYYYRVTYKF